MMNNSPYASPVSSTSSPVAAADNIRERTRQAIAKHRRHREDLQRGRTTIGASPSSASASLSPKGSRDSREMATNTMPIVEPIYQEIELHPYQQYEGRLHVHVPQQQEGRRRSRRRRGREAEDAEVSSPPPPGKPAPQQRQLQYTDFASGSGVGSPPGAGRFPEPRARAAPASSSGDHRPTIRGNPYVYTGPFNSEAAVRMGYKPPSEQDVIQQPIIYRQEFVESGSVQTGMSQQELIRKKARESSAQRREQQKRKKKFGKTTKRKPIVQLPASLLQSTAAKISPPRTTTTTEAHYVMQDGDDNKKAGDNKSRSSPWNTLMKGLSLSRSTSDEIESSTAETTHETPTATNNPAAAPVAGSFAAAVAPSTNRSRVEAASSKAAVVDRIDDDEVKEDDDGGCSFFPILSKNNSQSGGGVAQKREDVAAAAASAWMTAPPPPPSISKSPDTTTTTYSRASSNNEASSSESSSGRGVRFADSMAVGVGDDDDEEVPWDQRTDMAKHRSPTSVLEGVAARMERGGKPKSILRSSKFKPTSGSRTRYYGSERRALDFESLRLGDRPAGSSDDQDEALPRVDFDKEERIMVDYSWAKQAAVHTSISRHLDPDKAMLSTSRESQQSSEVPPPSPTGRGFMADNGSEISSILSNPTATTGGRSPPPPSSGVAGHPAEKHYLQESIATARNMHRGGIAARVIEEDYPDPPLTFEVSLAFASPKWPASLFRYLSHLFRFFFHTDG